MFNARDAAERDAQIIYGANPTSDQPRSYLRANFYRLIVDALCFGKIHVCPKFRANFGDLLSYFSLLSLALGPQFMCEQLAGQKRSHNGVD